MATIFDNVKTVKDNVTKKINKLTEDDVLAIGLGMTLGLTAVCIGQQIQIDNLNKKLNNTTKAIKKISDIAYGNDVKAYNNTLMISYGMDAIVECLKGTHPGIQDAVDKAIVNAQMDFIA